MDAGHVLSLIKGSREAAADAIQDVMPICEYITQRYESDEDDEDLRPIRRSQSLPRLTLSLSKFLED